MSRTRNLKPGLFQNELLAELPFEGRLLFAGLPILADRDGRLEDRPRRIKAALFPFDGHVAIDDLLAGLAEREFITRYQVEAVAVIQITNFLKHQSPHPKEQKSVLPENPNKNAKPRLVGESRGKNMTSHAGSSGSSGSSGSTRTSSGGSSEPPPAASEPSVLLFDCVGTPNEWALVQSQIDEWQQAFPNLDVPGECRKAHVWLRSDSQKRKTSRGMLKFLGRWMIRAVDDRRGGNDRRNTPPPAPREPVGRPRGCRHEPLCADDATHTARSLRDRTTVPA